LEVQKIHGGESPHKKNTTQSTFLPVAGLE